MRAIQNMGKILLVFDKTDSDFQRLLPLLVSRFPEYDISSCERGEDVLLAAIESQPIAILVDHKFNGVGGYSVIRSLKNSEFTRNIPVYFFHDFVDLESVGEAVALGADDFFRKPIVLEELLPRLAVLLRNAKIIKDLRSASQRLNDFAVAATKAGNSLIMVNANGDIEWVNGGFEKLYGCNLEQFKQLFGANMFSDNLPIKTIAAFRRCRENGEYVTYVNSWTMNDGTVKEIQTSLSPAYDHWGNFYKIICIETDVSDLKAVEHELEYKNAHITEANQQLEQQRSEIEEQKRSLEEEKKKSEELLQNILPMEIARQLTRKGTAKPKPYKDVSVLFTDFVGFSSLTRAYDALELIEILDHYFQRFEQIGEGHFLEKIKTIGDAYMCAGGLPRTNKSHAFDAVLAALEIKKFVADKAHADRLQNKSPWGVKIGIHSGEVIAGVIGRKKFAYDIWGDTVNVASRMQEASEPGKINISQSTYDKVKDFFECTPRGEIPVKNIGSISMYYVERILPELSDDADGVYPNAAFKKILATY